MMRKQNTETENENMSSAIAINTTMATRLLGWDWMQAGGIEREGQRKRARYMDKVKDKMPCPITMCDKVQIELILSYFPEIK